MTRPFNAAHAMNTKRGCCLTRCLLQLFWPAKCNVYCLPVPVRSLVTGCHGNLFVAITFDIGPIPVSVWQKPWRVDGGLCPDGYLTQSLQNQQWKLDFMFRSACSVTWRQRKMHWVMFQYCSVNYIPRKLWKEHKDFMTPGLNIATPEHTRETRDIFTYTRYVLGTAFNMFKCVFIDS